MATWTMGPCEALKIMKSEESKSTNEDKDKIARLTSFSLMLLHYQLPSPLQAKIPV